MAAHELWKDLFASMFVASKKGFAQGRWWMAFGLLGLVVVCCLPGATSREIPRHQARARAKRANSIGAVLCGLNLLFLFVYGLALAFMTSSRFSAYEFERIRRSRVVACYDVVTAS